jgi:uncharacterized protein (TIGR03435 family)
LSGPTSIQTQLYNIVANVPEGTTKEQFALMLQRLLEERFKLSMHRQSKEQPVYELTVGRGGPKFTQSVEEPPAADGGPPDNPKPLAAAKIAFDQDGYPVIPPGAGFRVAMRGGRTTHVFNKTSMDEFVAELSGLLARPVINATGLDGKYDITLHYVEDSQQINGREVPAPAAGPEPGPSIVSAVPSQLGLKLDSKKATIDTFVVDHVESVPTAN